MLFRSSLIRGDFDIEIMSITRTLFEVSLTYKFDPKLKNLIQGDFDLEIFSSSCEDIEIFPQLLEDKIFSHFHVIIKYILRCFLGKPDP